MTSTKHAAAHEAAQAQPCPNPGQQPQARACDTCIHKGGTLPSDWHALDYFDRRAVAGQASHRLACTAVPDTDKPCLNREPASASQAPAAINAGVLPTAQQAIQLALLTVRYSLRHAQRLIREDFDGCDATAPHDSTLALVLAHLDAIAAAAPTSWDDMDGPWWRAYEAVRLVARTLDKGDCTAQRYLDGAICEFEALAGAVELLEDTP